MVIQSFTSVGGALIIGFVYSWQMALILIAFTPFMVISGVVRAKFIYGKQGGGGNNASLEEGGKVCLMETQIFISYLNLSFIYRKIVTILLIWQH